MVIMKSNLKVLMVKNDLTQHELAEKVGIDVKFINRLANGKAKFINTDSLIKLGIFFKCPIQDLLYYEEIA
mgnify:CR=1 FL=1